jgi:hypothetical protein
LPAKPTQKSMSLSAALSSVSNLQMTEDRQQRSDVMLHHRILSSVF